MSKKHLRIAVLGTRGIPDVMGGVETHCQALYPRLVKKGHSVTVFARKGYVAGVPYAFEGVKVIPLWAPRKKSLEAICQTTIGVLRVAAQKKKFDVLHIHAIGPALLVPLARLLGLKVVMTHHGPDYDRQKWGFLAKVMLRLGERLGCRYANSFITVSCHIRSLVHELYKCEGTYIPNGVVYAERIPAGIHLNRWSLNPKKYFLAVGRLVPEKGFHNLLTAFGRVATDWNLVIAGSNDHGDEYSRNLLEQAALDDRVIMTGFIRGDVLAEIFSNAGLFVLPSYHEGLPIAVLEAMSYKLPILISDIPANRELADSSEMFPVGNVDTLQQKLEQYLHSPWSTAKGYRRIENEFNWDFIADRTERVYWDVCGQ